MDLDNEQPGHDRLPASFGRDASRPGRFESTGGLLRNGLSRADFLKVGAQSAVVLSALISMEALVACGDDPDDAAGAGPPPERPVGLARIGLLSKPDSLDPAKIIGVEAYTIAQNSYEGLVAWREEPTRLQPALATEWSSNSDATEWTFKLRKGVKFHDGESLTSEAVKLSFEYFLNAEGSFLAATVGNFDRIDASDPATVTIRYPEPFPDLPRNAPYLGIVSPGAFRDGLDGAGRKLENASFGAGPFRFESGFRGQVLQVAAFDGYWGDGPYLETLEYEAIPEESSRLAALQAGDIDFVPQVSPIPLRQLSSGDRYNDSATLTWSQHYLLFACDQEPFSDVRMRRAAGFAVNRDLIVEKILGGQADLAKSPMPPGCYGYAETSAQYPYDVERAKALVKEAVDAGISPSLELVTDIAPIRATQVAQAVGDQLRDAGFDVTVRTVSSASVTEDILRDGPRKYGLILVQFGWINGGPYFFGGGFDLARLARYDGPVVELSRRIQTTADGPERLRLIKEAQESGQQDLYVYNMYNLRFTDVMRAPLTGYRSPRNAFAERFGGMYRPGDS